VQEAYERARRVRLVIFDVDGVMTDGRIFVTDTGDEMKAFHSRDGQGMKLLKLAGLETAIISGRNARCVEVRAQNLEVGVLYQGVEDKGAVFEELLGRLKLSPEQAAYIGDDIIDLPVMRRCGLAACVPEAPEVVRAHAHYICKSPGGRGAVREWCELILHAQGRFDDAMARYLD
jgi:3-deoxy-D-manno-octulosonate 8-phosphate phosphatase (KDO 8-P phosphatase)